MALLSFYISYVSLLLFFIPLNKTPLRNPILLFLNSIGSVGGGGGTAKPFPKWRKKKRKGKLEFLVIVSWGRIILEWAQNK